MKDPNLRNFALGLPASETRIALDWLADNLEEGEKFVSAIHGSKDFRCPDWLVLTNKRLCYTTKSMVRILDKQNSFIFIRLQDVRDIRFEKKMMRTFGEVKVFTSSGVIVLDQNLPEQAHRFIGELNVVRTMNGR